MTRVKHHSKGYKQLLVSDEMVRRVAAEAQRVADASGSGYVAETTDRPHTRARAAVITATGEARRDNAANNTMLKNL